MMGDTIIASTSTLAQPKWRLFTSKKVPVCNFLPQVILVEDIIDPQTNEVIESKIHLVLDFGAEKSKEFVLPLSTLSRIIWSDIERRCITNPDCRQARRHIENSIRANLEKAPCQKCFRLDHTGAHRIGDEIVFVAGNQVITKSKSTFSESDFDTSQLPFRLDIDPKLPPQKAFEGMCELINLSPQISHILIAHVVAGFIRSSFIEVGFKPTTVLFIVGESGMLKSHYVPHMVQLYNRNDEIRAVTRLNSTSRFIEETLCEYCDCTAVVDDLHTAGSQKIKRNNENTAEEIIRRVSDDTGRGFMNGKAHVQRSFCGNVVFIGEYLFGKASTIPRALVINLINRPNGSVLDKYQRTQKLTVSTFYYYFLKWYMERYDAVCDNINQRLSDFRQKCAVSENHGRMNDTQFYLDQAYMVFLSFYNSFSQSLNKALQQQLLRYKEDRTHSSKIEVAKYIGQLYKNRHLKIAESVDVYRLRGAEIR